MGDGSPGIATEVADGIGWLVFDHPQRHNALTREMLASLPAACARLDDDDAVRVVVLRGAGERAFVSGADISQLRELPPGSGGRDLEQGSGAEAVLAIEKPVIAMIHGHCLGAGVLIALCADLRLAADDAGFAIPAARLGVGYPHAAVESLVGLVGRAAASEILFTAGRIDAAAALRVGLVSGVLPKSELEAAVRRTAASIAASAPLTLRAAKASIRRAAGQPGAPDVEECQRRILACWSSEDFAEGRRAFGEKREPRFRGR